MTNNYIILFILFILVMIAYDEFSDSDMSPGAASILCFMLAQNPKRLLKRLGSQ